MSDGSMRAAVSSNRPLTVSHCSFPKKVYLCGMSLLALNC